MVSESVIVVIVAMEATQLPRIARSAWPKAYLTSTRSPDAATDDDGRGPGTRPGRGGDAANPRAEVTPTPDEPEVGAAPANAGPPRGMLGA
jgi:hypothetical protein